MLTEGRDLCAALGLFGLTPKDVSSKVTRAKGNPRRIDRNNDSSENLLPLREATRFLLGKTDGSWLRRWLEDQLADPSTGSVFAIGLGGRENGRCHYFAFLIALVAAILRRCMEMGNTAPPGLSAACREWLRLAFAWLALFGPGMVVGQRNQRHGSDVVDALVEWYLTGHRDPRSDQPSGYYWPLAVTQDSAKIGFPEAGETTGVAAHLLSVWQGKDVPSPIPFSRLYTRDKFEWWAWDAARAAAMFPAHVVPYGSPALAAVDVIGVGREPRILEPDSDPRKARQWTVDVVVEPNSWAAIATVPGASMRIVEPAVGRLWYRAETNGDRGGITVTTFGGGV